jgi:hypothetical protein
MLLQLSAHLPVTVSYEHLGSATHCWLVVYLTEHLVVQVVPSWHAGCCKHVAEVRCSQDVTHVPEAVENIHCESALQSIEVE